jgi:hypothetical protein
MQAALQNTVRLGGGRLVKKCAPRKNGHGVVVRGETFRATPARNSPLRTGPSGQRGSVASCQPRASISSCVSVLRIIDQPSRRGGSHILQGTTSRERYDERPLLRVPQKRSTGATL